MSRSRFIRLAEVMRRKQIDYVLLSSLASLRYFTGFAAAIETGPSPFTSIPGILLAGSEEQPLFLLADSESAGELYGGIRVETFASYTIDKPLCSISDLGSKLRTHLGGLLPVRVGVELESLSAAILESLRMQCSGLKFVDVEAPVSRLRMIKDAEEIQTLRECCALCDVGQQLVTRLVAPGMTEIELFEEVRAGMEMQEGGRLALLADVVSGERTAGAGGSPTPRRIEAGDPVIVDLVPRHNGYWGDSCNTCIAGEPSAEQRRFFSGLSDVLQRAIESIRPGLRACDLDALVRADVLKLGGGYPHHTGHGLGVTWHEEPRIVPYNSLPLEEGMVIALEPGVYFDGRWGMRIEYVVRVTETGAEILSKFPHTLSSLEKASTVSTQGGG